MHFKNKRYYYLLCVIFFSVIGCSDNSKFNDDTWSGSKIMMLGHRGMGMYYKMPGNTFQSVTPAIGIGADGCELDIQLTRDTVLVFYHDHLLKPNTTCNGRIYESDWADIQQCKYYAVENNIFINSVDDLFSKISNINDLYFSFDCGKVDEEATDVNLYEMQYLRAIKRICEKYNMSNHIFIEGTFNFLIKAQQMGLTNKLFLYSDLDEQAIELADSNSFFGISTGLDGLNISTEEAHKKGLYVMVWSPDNFTQNKLALSKNVDIIQTDDPISLLKLVNRFNYEYIIP